MPVIHVSHAELRRLRRKAITLAVVVAAALVLLTIVGNQLLGGVR